MARRSFFPPTSGVMPGLRKISFEASRVSQKPINYHSFGILKVLTISTPFVCVGAYIAKTFALYLEDLDLFVPDDDDD